MKRIEITIKGHVQGVYFRASTQQIASPLNLDGFVKNQNDSSVLVIAEGPEEKLARLLEYCKKGPQGAIVEDIKVKFTEATEEFKGFSIRN